ncbi:hypothetical protein C4J81_15530 [Deltaproteobacteria bacterium Smac51]|nr:hypothetical protein C4J81_15530 [Deltaproteobacteria bacterium Smac51]
MSTKSKKETKEWLLSLHPHMFSNLWGAYTSESHARRGWLQIEIIERFPEFIKWVSTHEDPQSLSENFSSYRDEDGGISIHEPPAKFDGPKKEGRLSDKMAPK